MQMFDDFDHGGDHGGDHDGDHDGDNDDDHGGGDVDDDDAGLVARQPKQQCGSDDSSSTSGLPESHFPPFSSTLYLLTFSSVCFFTFRPFVLWPKRFLPVSLAESFQKEF